MLCLIDHLLSKLTSHTKAALAQVAEWIIAERTVSSEDDDLDKLSHDVGNHVPGCEVSGLILVSRAPGVCGENQYC